MQEETERSEDQQVCVFAASSEHSILLPYRQQP